jgi:hypothetical protein
VLGRETGFWFVHVLMAAEAAGYGRRIPPDQAVSRFHDDICLDGWRRQTPWR